MEQTNENGKEALIAKMIERLEKKLDDMALIMEKMKIAEYVSCLEHPRKFIWTNFLGGVAKGFGTIIGLTVVAAVLVYFLQFLLELNLPLISAYIADFIRLIQKEL